MQHRNKVRSTNNLSWFFLVSIKCWFQCVSLNLQVRKVQIILLFQRLLLCAASRTVACQAPLSKGFFRQEYWSGLPFPLPWDHPDPGITPGLFLSPALQADYLPLCHLGRGPVHSLQCPYSTLGHSVINCLSINK